MNKPVPSETLASWIAGESVNDEMERRAPGCGECRVQLSEFENALKLFGTTVRNWSEKHYVAREYSVPLSENRAASSLGYFWLALGGTLLLFICSNQYFQVAPASDNPRGSLLGRSIDSDSANASDAALLSRLAGELSQTAPASLEPLAQFVGPSDRVNESSTSTSGARK